MEIEWSDEHSSHNKFVLASLEGFDEVEFARLDSLFPADPETGVATFTATRSYINAMIDMTERGGYPLSLICFSVDETPILTFFGTEGATIIGRGVARCLRQESRVHDVVGRTTDVDAHGLPNFLVVCPLMDEEHTAHFAERLHQAMRTSSQTDTEHPWMTLSAGVASMALDVTSADDLIARAVGALRHARRHEEGRIWRHSESMREFLSDWQENEEPPADEQQ